MADSPIELLISDHNQMRRMLEEMTVLMKADPLDISALVEKAGAFEAFLGRHERREEEVLFPPVGGMGPVQLVLQEHHRLTKLREQMVAALTACQDDPTPETSALLSSKVQEVAYNLAGHFMKEEQLVFRIAQASFGPEEMAEMLAKMNAIPLAS